ncbi:MAG: hypothetical protein FJX67_18795, partial [Alphaproteobacteria bacterium]|nr:hypothetical protein [Alphaproteobacteria bacterium]
DDHFSVDGTLIDAWASMKSFRPKDAGGAGGSPAGGGGGRNADGGIRARDARAARRGGWLRPLIRPHGAARLEVSYFVRLMNSSTVPSGSRK